MEGTVRMRNFAQLSPATSMAPAPPMIDTFQEKEDFMTPSDRERVTDLMHTLLERQTVYSYCASYYGKRYYWLTIPSIVITTTISVLGAIWPYEGSSETAGRVIISVLGALATVITATLALVRFQSKMDIFYNAAVQVDGMVSRLSFLTKYRMGENTSRAELQHFISGIEDKLNDVRTKVPPIPTYLYIAGCSEEDKMLDLRVKRANLMPREEIKQGWAEVGADAPDSPKDGQETSQKWC
mmetsp:Transcript_9266/g.23025  ORF Transcript_9266/g.23025 Transcript_9266/m.23025 type:complete len:240 (+) Transcript_9266:53-772(+)